MRKIAETKAKEKAKKQILMEKKKKQKQMEHLKQLQGTTLLEGTEAFQVIRSKHKKIATISSEDKVRWQFSKKIKEKQLRKYYSNATVKIEVLTYMRGMYMSGRTVWCTIAGE